MTLSSHFPLSLFSRFSFSLIFVAYSTVLFCNLFILLLSSSFVLQLLGDCVGFDYDNILCKTTFNEVFTIKMIQWSRCSLSGKVQATLNDDITLGQIVFAEVYGDIYLAIFGDGIRFLRYFKPP